MPKEPQRQNNEPKQPQRKEDQKQRDQKADMKKPKGRTEEQIDKATNKKPGR